MDSLPQELIDAIIDNVPQPTLPSCSLVAKRWRRKSQQRVLATISFRSEGEVKRWCTDIPRDSDGISSYVCHVDLVGIYFWTEPALLSRMLGSLNSLAALSIYGMVIPDELPGRISQGELGKGITTLDLHLSYCTLATLTSMILSLPSLKELSVEDLIEDYEAMMPNEPFSTYSVTPERGPLDSLKLYRCLDGVGEALAKFRFTSRRLDLRVDITGIKQLLLLSSEMVVELTLWDDSAREALPPTHLPSFPSLATLTIYIYMDRPSPHLKNILSSIGSAPALTSIIIGSMNRVSLDYLPLVHLWVDVDRWLSRVSRHAKVEGGLLLTLKQWTVWEGFFPEFRESGGKIKVDDSGR